MTRIRNLNRKPGLKCKRLVFVSLLILGVIFIIGRREKIYEDTQAKTIAYASQITRENNQISSMVVNESKLQQQLDFSAKITTTDQTKNISTYYIHKYFQPKDWGLITKVMTCESNLNNTATNWRNLDGSTDRGLFMINSVHTAQFKRITGVDYTVGAYDWDTSSKFAKWLFDTSGIQAWVCYGIVK